MSIHQVGAAVGAAAAPAVESGAKESFGQVLRGSSAPRTELSPTAVSPPAAGSAAQRGCSPEASAGISQAHAQKAVDSVQAARSQSAAKLIDRVTHAQAQMDRVLAQARSGRSFSPAELLALQAQVYQSSQELDLAGKVVEKATSGVKQVLQTQV